MRAHSKDTEKERQREGEGIREDVGRKERQAGRQPILRKKTQRDREAYIQTHVWMNSQTGKYSRDISTCIHDEAAAVLVH